MGRQPEIVDGKRMPTLYEVMQDDDFLPELRQNNELLIKFLTMERLENMVKLLIEEPTFKSSADRSYKLPFIASQALCVDTPHI